MKNGTIVRVTKEDVIPKTGIARATGKPYSLNLQKMTFIDAGDPTNAKTRSLNIGSRPPYPVGDYVIGADTFYDDGPIMKIGTIVLEKL